MFTATVRSTKPRPMVSISTANGGPPIIGRTTTRSTAMPKASMATKVSAKPARYGNPARLTQVNATNAPSIINSPCAKLSISVAL